MADHSSTDQPTADRAGVSVITVAGDHGILGLMHASLVAQDLTDWQWVVVPRPGTEVPDALTDDPRVVVLGTDGSVPATVGASKLLAAQAASGDVLVDLDDGDVLAGPGALGALAAHGDVITYGDVAVTAPGDSPGQLPAEYAPGLGWQVGTDPDAGSVPVVQSFDPTPSALHVAAYAPRHGLAWPRQVYLQLGGPHPELAAEADWDLLCRAVATGVAITRVPQCTVVSHRRAHRPGDVVLAQRLSNSHVRPLVAAWCATNGLAMLDLGAAHNPEPGYTSVDLHDADITCDIRYGLPVPDDSVGCIRAVDFLEHLPRCPDSSCVHGADGGPRCAVGVMNEFHRALAPGGWLVTATPSTDGRGAFQDPTHVSFWNPNSFWYYTRRDQARFVPGITCRFQAARLWQDFPSPWHQTHNIPYVYADLVALKGQHQPGPVEI
jgi:hypothetical protein